MGKAWPALDIHVPSCDPQLQELVLAELDDFQPTAIHEPEDDARLRVFFLSPDSRDAAQRALRDSFGAHLFVEPLDVHDEDWAARSQKDLRSIAIGRLVISPPWDRGTAKRGREQFSGDTPENCSRPLFVVINPSMGFGTGHHATTRLVLRALQELTLEGKTVVDIGCGSGVLAIAAVKLGAESALGIDIDGDALENARENAGLNSVGGRVAFEEGDFQTMQLSADIVLANLTGALLERTAAQLSALVHPGGHLIVSGFMNTESGVTRELEQFLTLIRVDAEGEWLCALLAGRR